ncbi:MAG: Na+/H+ antiporter subunit E [Nitrospirales bacterium]|nr:Na+/H+ antiporter subunit E [Nitrospirales bacterium]
MTSSFPKQLLFNTLALFGVWLVLSGRYDLFHVVIGFMVACGVAWLNTGFAHSAFHQFPWVRAVLYVPWLFLRVVQSSLHLTKLILSPSLPIRPKLIFYRSHLRHQGAMVMLGNSVTLTPGTITVEVNGSHLLVHTIDEEAGEDLTSGRMEKKIAQVFQEETKDR